MYLLSNGDAQVGDLNYIKSNYQANNFFLMSCWGFGCAVFFSFSNEPLGGNQLC